MTRNAGAAGEHSARRDLVIFVGRGAIRRVRDFLLKRLAGATGGRFFVVYAATSNLRSEVERHRFTQLSERPLIDPLVGVEGDVAAVDELRDRHRPRLILRTFALNRGRTYLCSSARLPSVGHILLRSFLAPCCCQRSILIYARFLWLRGAYISFCMPLPVVVLTSISGSTWGFRSLTATPGRMLVTLDFRRDIVSASVSGSGCPVVRRPVSARRYHCRPVFRLRLARHLSRYRWRSPTRQCDRRRSAISERSRPTLDDHLTENTRSPPCGAS